MKITLLVNKDIASCIALNRLVPALVEHQLTIGLSAFVGNVEIKDDKLLSPNQEVQIISEANPSQLPWKKNKIDIVIEATGIFRTKEQLQKHLELLHPLLYIDQVQWNHYI